jgi:hypothetical protein
MAAIALYYIAVPGKEWGSTAEGFFGHGFPYLSVGGIAEAKIPTAAQRTIHADVKRALVFHVIPGNGRNGDARR